MEGLQMKQLTGGRRWPLVDGDGEFVWSPERARCLAPAAG
jgi:hypothetical protein